MNTPKRKGTQPRPRTNEQLELPPKRAFPKPLPPKPRRPSKHLCVILDQDTLRMFEALMKRLSIETERQMTKSDVLRYAIRRAWRQPVCEEE